MTAGRTLSFGELRFLLGIVAACTAIVGGQLLIAGYAIVANSNFREVVPRKAYRSAQPSVAELRKWAGRCGIKTVINLRGYNLDELSEREQEQEVARELGIAYIEQPLKVHALLPADSLKKLIHTIETAERPLLLHCQRGVDRAGTVSALAAMAIGEKSFEEAKWQAYIAPGPWKRSKEGDYVHISDVLVQYEQFCRNGGLGTEGWEQFKSWAAEQ